MSTMHKSGIAEKNVNFYKLLDLEKYLKKAA
jgi:hypothetical protein